MSILFPSHVQNTSFTLIIVSAYTNCLCSGFQVMEGLWAAWSSESRAKVSGLVQEAFGLLRQTQVGMWNEAGGVRALGSGGVSSPEFIMSHCFCAHH